MFCRSALALALACAPSAVAAQEREWQFDTNETEAYLVFGVPQTDDAGIGFHCAIRSGDIRIFVPAETMKPGKPVDLAFEAGGERFTYKAAVETNEESGIVSATVNTTTGDGFFEALKANDRFKLILVKHETVFPLMNADVAALLRVCGKS
jgi:hypothetical protein